MLRREFTRRKASRAFFAADLAFCSGDDNDRVTLVELERKRKEMPRLMLVGNWLVLIGIISLGGYCLRRLRHRPATSWGWFGLIVLLGGVASWLVGNPYFG